MTEDISDADINSALANIGRTSDGRLLYRYLQRELMGIARTSENGALQVHHGTRTLAANLMARMSSGIAEKSSDYASAGRFDLIVFTAPKPIDTGARRQSARDFLNNSEPST